MKIFLWENVSWNFNLLSSAVCQIWKMSLHWYPASQIYLLVHLYYWYVSMSFFGRCVKYAIALNKKFKAQKWQNCSFCLFEILCFCWCNLHWLLLELLGVMCFLYCFHNLDWIALVSLMEYARKQGLWAYYCPLRVWSSRGLLALCPHTFLSLGFWSYLSAENFMFPNH